MTRLSREYLIKVEKCSPLLPQPGPEVVEELMGHIWALEADLTTARAEYEALLAEWHSKWDTAITERDHFRLSLVEARAECAALLEKAAEVAHNEKNGDNRVIENRIRALITIPQAAALREHDDKLQAGTAALLEKLADKWHQTLFPEHTPYNQGQELGMEKCADDVRTAITTGQAAALAERLAGEAGWWFANRDKITWQLYGKRLAHLRAIVECEKENK